VFLALTPLTEYAESFTDGLAYGLNVRFGSKADIDGYQRDVRFTPEPRDLEGAHYGSARVVYIFTGKGRE